MATALAYINSVAVSGNLALADTTNANTQTSGTSFWSATPNCFSLQIEASCDNRTYSAWIRSNLLATLNTFSPRSMYDICATCNTMSNILAIPSELNINGTVCIKKTLIKNFYRSFSFTEKCQ